MADHNKGFKTAGGHPKGFKSASNGKPMIKEMPRTKRPWDIPWKWLAILIATPVIFHQCSQDDPVRRYDTNKDTAPPQTGHDWRDAERAAEGLPPISSLKGESRLDAHALRQQQLADEALPTGPGMEARRAGFNAIVSKLYTLPASVTAEIDRIMTHRDPNKPIYDVVKVDRSQQFHIAAAKMGKDNIVNSFICVQKGLRVEDIYHAQATSDGQVRINETIPHPGNYLTGRNLMEMFGDKNCADGLYRLHKAMNGTGETDALNTPRNIREAGRRFNDRGLKSPYSY